MSWRTWKFGLGFCHLSMAVPSAGCLIRSWLPKNWKRWGSCWPIWPRRKRANKFLEPQLMGSVLSFLFFLWLGLLRRMLRVWLKKLYSKTFKVSSDDRNHFVMALSSHICPRRHSSRRTTCFPMFRPSSIYIFSMVSSSGNLYVSIKLSNCGPNFWMAHSVTFGLTIYQEMEIALDGLAVFDTRRLGMFFRKPSSELACTKGWKNRWGTILYYYTTIHLLYHLWYTKRNLGAWSKQIEGSSSSVSAKKKAKTNRKKQLLFTPRRVMRFMTMMYAEVLPNTSGVKFGLRHLVFDG